MRDDVTVLCGANAYEQKYYFNEQFSGLPDAIKDELHIIAVLFTEEIGGIFTVSFDEEGEVLLSTDADEEDILYDEIGRILGLDREHNLIIIGGGNLGSALAGYGNFANRGFIMKGVFDVSPSLAGQYIRNIPILPMSALPEFIEKNNIDIAVIAIPKTQAVAVADTLVKCGIKAIWNFSHVDLEVPDDVVVESVHLSESLMRLSYNLSRVGFGEEPDND